MSEATDKGEAAITELEKRVLASAIEKLNGIARVGRGESLTEDETLVFMYWKKRGKVRAVENARFGEIYEMTATK